MAYEVLQSLKVESMKQTKSNNPYLHCTTPFSSPHSCPLGHELKVLNTWHAVAPKEIGTAEINDAKLSQATF